MKSQKLNFNNKNGHSLSARIDFPVDQKPTAFAIFAHCFTCSKNLLAIKNISRGLNSKGIAVLLFDFTGLGESEGDFESTSFTSNINDLFAANDFLKEKFEAPKIMIGHSLGGAAALFAAAKLENIEAVVTIGAPFEPFHVTKLLTEGIDEIKKRGKATVNIGGRPFSISKEFLEDLEKQKPEEIAKALRKPLLILHSPQDTTVGIENAAKIYSAALHPKSFISLDGADHLLSKKADSSYAGNMIAAWVEKYLDPDNRKSTLKSNSKVVVQTNEESLTTEIKAGKHHFLADEPEEVGGSDLGPTPYDLLSSALGACTSMTLQMYAKRKKWDLKEAKVHLDHNKDYAQDCDDCEKSSAKIDHFNRRLELKGDLDEKQKQRLLEIADKCPVHKTLHSSVKVITELA
ncbi:MAG: OsmC family protein [Flavobacteriales bacterium]|nr:OsmC family protein [Flavobacteriales bacterium]